MRKRDILDACNNIIELVVCTYLPWIQEIPWTAVPTALGHQVIPEGTEISLIALLSPDKEPGNLLRAKRNFRCYVNLFLEVLTREGLYFPTRNRMVSVFSPVFTFKCYEIYYPNLLNLFLLLQTRNRSMKTVLAIKFKSGIL